MSEVRAPVDASRVIAEEKEVAVPGVEKHVRSQRSDFPAAPAEQLFERVRDSIGQNASAHGFSEVRAETRNITDPVDDSHVLDVWHELTFAKGGQSIDQLIEDVRWALRVPKCIDP